MVVFSVRNNKLDFGIDPNSTNFYSSPEELASIVFLITQVLKDSIIAGISDGVSNHYVTIVGANRKNIYWQDITRDRAMFNKETNNFVSSVEQIGYEHFQVDWNDFIKLIVALTVPMLGFGSFHVNQKQYIPDDTIKDTTENKTTFSEPLYELLELLNAIQNQGGFNPIPLPFLSNYSLMYEKSPRALVLLGDWNDVKFFVPNIIDAKKITLFSPIKPEMVEIPLNKLEDNLLGIITNLTPIYFNSPEGMLLKTSENSHPEKVKVDYVFVTPFDKKALEDNPKKDAEKSPIP